MFKFHGSLILGIISLISFISTLYSSDIGCSTKNTLNLEEGICLYRHAKILRDKEELFTNHMALTESDLKNITLASFIIVQDYDIVNIDIRRNNKDIVFISGQVPSSILNAQQKMKTREQAEKAIKFNSLRNLHNSWLSHEFNIYPKFTEDIKRIFKHFEHLWIPVSEEESYTLSPLEKAFFDQSILKTCFENATNLATSFILPTLFQAENTRLNEEDFITKKLAPLKKIKKEQILEDQVLVLGSLFASSSKEEEEEEEEEEENIDLKGKAGHSIIELFQKTQSHIKLSSFTGIERELETIFHLKDSLELLLNNLKNPNDPYDGIFTRWCSEQKLLNFLKEECTDWLQALETENNLSQINSIILLIHTFQKPCMCCRLSFSRFYKVFLKKVISDFLNRKDIPIRIAITYREEFKDDKHSSINLEGVHDPYYENPINLPSLHKLA